MTRKLINYIAMAFLIAGLALHMGHVQSKTSDAAEGYGKFVSMGCVGCHAGAEQRVPLGGHKLPQYNFDRAFDSLNERTRGRSAHPTLRVIGSSIDEQDLRNLAAFMSRD